MPTVDVDHQSVHYVEHGDPASPLLVLVHGLNGDSATVRPLAERLAETFHVVSPDALGHGRSARPDGFTLRDQGAMINGLVWSLGVGTATLAGISMGSYVVAQAAILDPALTSHLVLVVSKAHGTTSSSAEFAARKGVDLATLPMEDAIALLSEALWSPDTPQAKRDEIMAGPAPVPLSPAEQAAVERSLAGFDLRPDLGAITAPTLIVSGRSDGLNPPEKGEELAAGIAGARFEVYEHSGHMLASEEEGRLVAEIVAFAAA